MSCSLEGNPCSKKAKQFIHLEVELPLLEEVHFPEPVVIESPESIPVEPDKKGKKGKEKKSGKGSKKGGKAKKSPYAGPNEYNPSDEKNNFSFKTERLPWNKMMKFDPVFIESPDGNLVSISDTFKSSVTVRVVYLKVSPPKKKGKDKKSTKGKKEKKDKKDKKKDRKKSKEHRAESIIPVPVEEPTEVIDKRVTLCSFCCDLKPVNWSDESVDFYWADIPLFATNAQRVDGCLKDINYGEGKKSKKEKKSKSTSPRTASTTSAKTINVKNPIPKIFTCQVGFGLLRSVSQ